ncbi:hypothetical protein KC19_10G170900 [Ceratodon purpureus]|uniref:Uncharacterized protein n=1 Tax=Ceratodon purpureus TaxID=3225 RepID=A0A8T0GMQ7_CERPU|nr:hypothetical protein KC19_10G170900 [Ceratodon purpureus]
MCIDGVGGMKKYARLRQECSEFDNALYDATPEVSFNDESRANGESASPKRGDSPPTVVRSSQTGLTSGLAGAFKKLGSFREVSAARRNTETTSQWQGGPGTNNGSRSASARWPGNAQEEASESGRWVNVETASLSGRWGSVSTSDHWEDATQQGLNSFRDSLSLSRSGRLMQEGEPWTAPKPSEPIHRQPSPRDAAAQPPLASTNANPSDKTFGAAVQQNISMKETQGWLASVKRPLQPRKPPSTFEDPHEFNWRAATSTNGRERDPSSTSSRKTPTTISQSMRYDRLKTIDLVENPSYGDHRNGTGNHSIMQKAASMREGGAHSDAIMAMARAYSEKHGVPQAILECVACGRALGVIVQGDPANDTSFCQSCRPHAIGAWMYHTKAPESGKSKRKGMMHFCKKILRMGKKPNKSKG